MVQEKSQSSDTNMILENWEFLDSFLDQFNKTHSKDKKQSKSILDFFSSLFQVKEGKSNTPSINTIREKLWLYYYKERIKKVSQRSKTDQKKLYS